MTAPRLPLDPAIAPLLHGARRRWRVRHLAVGVAILTAVVVGVLLISTWALAALRFSADAISTTRAVLAIVAVIAVARWIVWPLARRLPDDRLALYLEDRVPQLGGAVLTAVTLRDQSLSGHSSGLERQLVADAARRLRTEPSVPVLERPTTVRALGGLFSIVLMFTAAMWFGPSALRTGVQRLLTPSRAAALAPVYRITLEPDSIIVPRGSDVQIGARTSGFAGDAADLVMRSGTDSAWTRVPMGRGADSTAFVVRLFDIAANAEYYVESDGVRSATGKLIVRELPGVSRIGVLLRFPAYMGLPPDSIDDGGDIAAPGGTAAQLRVHATRPIMGGRLVFDQGDTVALTRLDDSTVTATFSVRRDGFYRVELLAIDSTAVRGTVEYAVDALDDAPPTVRIVKPGRDIRPTSVDEILIEAEATDDYGVGSLEIVYRVNGGDEKSVTLASGRGVRPREVVATHTLFLEEMGLTPGDVISYFARATDNDQRPRPKPGASDIQFLTIRPFRLDYRQNQQGGGGEGGGPQEMNPGSLVQQQREIVAGTFKTERDRATTPAATLRGDISTLHLAQGRLREELAALQARVSRPGAQAADSGFRVLAEVLPKAGAEMKAAEELLLVGKTADALAPEQRALKWLERAEAAFREVRVSMGQQGGGGGGGGGANASDLADLLELETDKLRNQYDQVQRGRQESASQQRDETLERLKQLAARQQQEVARQRVGQQGAGSTGNAQRQLADETERVARQLERLAREQQSQELASTAQEMRRAADAMRRSAANGGSGAAQAAAERLESARRSLENGREQSTRNGLANATERARALAAEQRDVAQSVEQRGAGAERADRTRRLDERKAGMEEQVKALTSDLERVARETRPSNPQAAQAAQAAASSIRQSRLADKIRFSRDVIRSDRSADYVRNFEQMIQNDLDSLAQRVAGAAGAVQTGRDSSQRSARALAQARELVRGLSSLDDRLRDRGASGGQQQGPREQGNGQQGQGRQGQGQQGQGQQGKGQQGQAQGQGGGAIGMRGAPTSGAPQPGITDASGQGAPRGARAGASFTAEDARQLSAELRDRRDGAQQLRRAVQGTGIDTRELDRAIARLGALDGAQVLGDPEALRQLQAGVIESLKSFEFALRRKLDASQAGGPALGGLDRVPAQYRELVNQYFKSLANQKER
jgi:hypothetical protein